MEKREKIANPVCRLLAQLSADYGVKHVVVSPGTRSAPLVLAFHREECFTLHTIIDERSAAFAALGMALESDSPVVLVCTSGSAMLNYASALSEAYYRRLPLIVISADRPARWIDQNDGQTIRQAGALSAVVRYSVDIPVAAATDSQLFDLANLQINDAFTTALDERTCGPVHINVQCDVPLTATSADEPRFTGRKICTIAGAHANTIPDALLHRLVGRRVLLVCGGLTRRQQAVVARYNFGNIPVLAEAQANVHGPNCIPAGQIDRFLASEGSTLIPDVVLTLGGSLVSARLKAWLRRIPALEHISLGYDDNATDTFGRLTMRVPMALEALEKIGTAQVSKSYFDDWQEFYKTHSPLTAEYVASNPVLTMIREIARKALGGVVHISNGSAIRYAQLVDWTADEVQCNRGVCGIDGSTSTALGASAVTDRPVLLITGDMSAAYDVGAFGAIAPRPNFKMIVLDNCGGDIFRNIRATGHLPELEQFFVVAPRFPLKNLAEAYGYDYFCAECGSGTDVVERFFAHNVSPAILHIKINPSLSASLL